MSASLTGEHGFVRWALAPTPSLKGRYVGLASPVMTVTGIRAVSGSSRSRATVA